jgi:CheY-like chemotaxis protein
MPPKTVPVRRCSILHIDDNAADAYLLRESLCHLVNVDFAHASNFLDAMDTIRQRSWDTKINLIILDWSLPRMEGTEILAGLKEDEETRPIPVIVLTGNISPKTIEDAYNGFASCVLRKPIDLDGLAELTTKIEQFWLQAVQLPFRERACGADA